MSIEWHKLRTLDGGQPKAFEELMCQLAGTERVPTGSLFVRKAAPDAGVECYWKLADGSEWGWQAKFFLSPPNAQQWGQLDESFKTALNKHPGLSRYVVCLPIDRSDPRVETQKSFMEEWDKRVKKWEQWSSENKMVVTFDYWGEHEIFERLSQEEHRGRHFFWFNTELFSDDWFRKRIEEAVVTVGPRYTPELDVKLPISQIFESLGKSDEFRKRIRRILKEIQEIVRYRISEPSVPELERLHQKLDEIFALMHAVDEDPDHSIDWERIVSLTREARDISYECSDKLATASESKKANDKSQKNSQEADRLRMFASEYKRLARLLPGFAEYAESNEADLANRPALLLTADAGRGKTHLLCDVATRRTTLQMPTVLLIGGNFNLDEPWSQIMAFLGLTCGRDEFLGALEAAAQVRGTRALILIDALNEGQGKLLWTQHLPALLLTISRSPWLGVCVSVRTSYEDAIIQEGLIPTRLIREVHHGFSDHEYQATKTFFKYFGVQQPSVPLLVPEFQNPLFLKIFCQGLHNNQMTTVPAGLTGITAVFRFFVDSINKKLSAPVSLDFNPNLPLVWRALDAISAEMAERGTTWLSVEKAGGLTNQVLPREGYENSLLRHLISEGVLAENRFYDDDTKSYMEGVHFAYERFTDHLIAKHLLDQHLKRENPAEAFERDRPLFKYVENGYACAIHRGLIEAFSVQLPERISKELFELIPPSEGDDSVVSAFVDSLMWRNPSTINVEVVRSYINRVIVTDYQHTTLLNCLLTIAGNPDNPLNADFLNRALKKQDIATRDSLWSIFLHEQYGEHGAVDRLIDWAWSAETKTHIEDEAIRLLGLTLCWFFTSSNRYLRDRATKALVNLLETRLGVLQRILNELLDVNDPYVLERLIAVTYGAVMRSNQGDAIAEIARDVYRHIFEQSSPPANILTRDYARGVIELANARLSQTAIDMSKVRPPYPSEFPDEIATEDELKAKYDNLKSKNKEIDYAASEIWESVIGFGDFARYVIGTNHGSFPWMSLRLNQKPPPTRRQRYEGFVNSLTKAQVTALERYRRVRQNVNQWKRQPLAERVKELKFEADDQLLDQVLAEEDKRFRKKLGKKKSLTLSEDLIEYIDFPHDDDFRFDLKLAQCWILQRVLELGWTVERFGQFDRYINYRDGRESNKPERIGKKYQWIAYYELLARIADNFKIRKDSWSGQNYDYYDGPWQDTYLRNIDPSCLITKTHDSGWNSLPPTWWCSVNSSWKRELTDKEWIRDANQLPYSQTLIASTNPTDGADWLNLESYFHVDNSPEEDDSGPRYPFRRINYWLQSFLVKKHDSDDVFQWMNGNWELSQRHVLPESSGTNDVFLGEFFWSPSFAYHNNPYYSRSGWTRGGPDNEIPKPILLTSDQYFQDRSYDCSIVEPITIRLPHKTIADEMELNWKGTEGRYYDRNDELVACDPSVDFVGPSALLVNRELFSKYLNDEEYDLIWVLTGEKLIITGGAAGRDWPGRMNFLGVFRLRNKSIDGNIITKVED